MKTKLTIKKVFQGALVIALALVFVALGNWQLDRSVIVKELNAAAKVIDPKIYSLGELAEPSVTLDSRNVNKSVALSGFYVANFKAHVQKDIDGQVSDWEVALLLVDGSRSWQHTAAIFRVLHALGWPWRLAWLAWLVPAPLRDALYRLVARHRYRLFGRSSSCMLPPQDQRSRFLD